MPAHPDLDLFAPYQLGPLHLANRMVMAPLTRSRAETGNVPSPLAVEYYAQRASAGLIVTEATQVSEGGQGYVNTPGVHSAPQVERWKQVTDAVHERGGRIFVQLWHVGRISHPDFRGGEQPIAPSAIAPRGVQVFTPSGLKAVPVPRAIDAEEIANVVYQFKSAAYNARAAGFDGVEIHGANGYLLDQFLEDGTNQRTDDYGGSVANRARLLMEVVDAVCDVWQRDRVGVRLSPGGTFNDMSDSDPVATFSYAVRELASRNLAYLHLIEPAPQQGEHPVPDLSARYFRTLYPGTLIVAGGYNLKRANAALKDGRADLVAFGQLFLANPDLPARFRQEASLNEPDPDTFYGGGARGYTDYPALDGNDLAM
jgi:N-ethylmaleimide reductase